MPVANDVAWVLVARRYAVSSRPTADAGPDPRADESAFVARFLEHGTVKMSPQPFVGPAADQTFPEFAKDIANLR